MKLDNVSLQFRGSDLPVHEILDALKWDLFVVHGEKRKRVEFDSDVPKSYCCLHFPYELPEPVEASYCIDNALQYTIEPDYEALLKLLDHAGIPEMTVSLSPYVYEFSTQWVRQETWQLITHPKVSLDLDVYFPIAQQDTFKHAEERTVWFGGGFNYEERFETSEKIDTLKLQHLLKAMPSSGGGDTIQAFFESSQTAGHAARYRYLVNISKKWNSGTEMSSAEIREHAAAEEGVCLVWHYWNPSLPGDVATS